MARRSRKGSEPRGRPPTHDETTAQATDVDEDAVTEESGADEDEEVADEDLDELFADEDEDAAAGGAIGPSEADYELWCAYAADPNQELRDQLIERYIPVVRQIAERMAAKLSTLVDINDLVQSGMLGLIDAIERFDHTLGYKFETFATQRIRGAIYDDLRRYDWVPRLIRNKSNKLDRERDRLETELQRPATEEEMAAYLDLSMDEYQELQREVSPKTMVSLDRKWDDGDDNEVGHLEMLRDSRIEDPLDELQRDEIKRLAVRGLNHNERAVLVMRYYHDMSLKEIGVVLDISESRVCQIHQQTLRLLRDKFAERGLDRV